MIGPEAHRAEVEAWRRSRDAALTRDLGWLTLSGLGWLRDGENRIGSDPTADVRLPAGPPTAGTLTVGANGATANGHFLHEGTPAVDVPMTSDHDGEPTILELGELRLCVIDRGGRLAVRTWDLASAARRTFAGIPTWPIDARWRLEASFVPTPGRTLAVPDVLGTSSDEPMPGEVSFTIEGVEYRLQALPGGDDGKLWLVFADATNGAETYGGGRFVYTEVPDVDSVIVDFNRAYNPPCVFSPFATCPLPWEANRLPIRVEAGEQLPRSMDRNGIE